MKQSRRPRKSRQQWQAIISELESSNLDVQDFCQQRNLNPGSVYAWRKRLGAAPFVELALGTAALSSDFAVELPDGVTVRVPATFDDSALGRLLATLRA